MGAGRDLLVVTFCGRDLLHLKSAIESHATLILATLTTGTKAKERKGVGEGLKCVRLCRSRDVFNRMGR